uniref:Uncharacterized protein n=1 Tax=Tanacetum cinerariifolium TaxID=118510 RepID=A0A699WQL5_TANCI|nr:hypothetical protein [Tanacetum cinerariifolium]
MAQVAEAIASCVRALNSPSSNGQSVLGTTCRPALAHTSANSSRRATNSLAVQAKNTTGPVGPGATATIGTSAGDACSGPATCVLGAAVGANCFAAPTNSLIALATLFI